MASLSIPVSPRKSPALKVAQMETRKTADLKPHSDNAKIYNDHADIDLIESVRVKGVINPLLITWDNRIINGHRRWEAAQKAGVDRLAVVIFPSHDELDILDALIESNRQRVKTKEQLGREFAALTEIYRQRSAQGKRSDLTSGDQLPEVRPTEKAAGLLGVDRHTGSQAAAVVKAVDQLKANGKKREAESLRSTLNQSIKKAYKTAQKRGYISPPPSVSKTMPTPPPPEASPGKDYSEHFRLIHGSMEKQMEVIEPGSIDIVITDPPYGRDALSVLKPLAKGAAHVLKPGGSLLVMIGQSYLPEVYDLLGDSPLTYQWTLSYLTPGGQAPQIWQRKVNTFWKPVLWYVNGEYKGDWIGDVAKSEANDNDKRFHHWGQSESGMASLIEKFTYPGQLILDPFLGGGTTGLVALSMKRRFIGIDQDETAIATSDRRLRQCMTEMA